MSRIYWSKKDGEWEGKSLSEYCRSPIPEIWWTGDDGDILEIVIRRYKMRIIAKSKVSQICMDGRWIKVLDDCDREFEKPVIICVRCLDFGDKDRICDGKNLKFEEHLQDHLDKRHISGVGEEIINIQKVIENGKNFMSQKEVYTK